MCERAGRGEMPRLISRPFVPLSLSLAKDSLLILDLDNGEIWIQEMRSKVIDLSLNSPTLFKKWVKSLGLGSDLFSRFRF